MKKINFNNLDQELYYFTLKNGLRVYLVPFLNKKNYYAILGTKYGSMDIEFLNNEGKKVKATQRPKKKEEKKQQPSLPPYFTGRGGR